MCELYNITWYKYQYGKQRQSSCFFLMKNITIYLRGFKENHVRAKINRGAVKWRTRNFLPNYRNMNMDYFGLFQVSFLKKNLFTPNWTLYHDLVQQYNCRWNRSRIGNRSRRDNLYPTKRTHPTWSCV